jgi:hypothetical protein
MDSAAGKYGAAGKKFVQNQPVANTVTGFSRTLKMACF